MFHSGILQNAPRVWCATVWRENCGSYIFSLLQEKCHQYWPAERSARYQYFVVDPMAEYNMPQYILREFKVTDARVSRYCFTEHCLKIIIWHHGKKTLNSVLSLADCRSRIVFPKSGFWPTQGSQGAFDESPEVHQFQHRHLNLSHILWLSLSIVFLNHVILFSKKKGLSDTGEFAGCWTLAGFSTAAVTCSKVWLCVKYLFIPNYGLECNISINIYLW